MQRQWFKWVKGRQQGSYAKFALFPVWLAQLLNADAYLLRFPTGCSVMKHKDPVAPGYNHHRMNIVLWGFGNGRMYTLGPVKRWMRVEIFRPDLYEHGLQPIKGPMLMLSFGCRVKAS
jgi:hypothetical protein